MIDSNLKNLLAALLLLAGLAPACIQGDFDHALDLTSNEDGIVLYSLLSNAVFVREPLPGAAWATTTTAAAFPARRYHSMTVFQNRLWIIGGRDTNNGFLNDVWYSDDGVRWNLATAGAFNRGRSEHAAFAALGKLWVVGGRISGDSTTNSAQPSGGDMVPAADSVWVSDDGFSWTRAVASCSSCPRYGQALVYNGKIFVIGTNSAFSSSDGLAWTETSTPFIDRLNGAFVFNSRMWLLELRSIFSSTNGTSFDLEDTFLSTEDRSFAGLGCYNCAASLGATALGFESFVQGSSIFTSGNYVYLSSTGRNWTPVATGCCVMGAPRSHAPTAVFQGRLYVSGGSRSFGNQQLLNDVIYTPGGTQSDGGSRSDFSL